MEQIDIELLEVAYRLIREVGDTENQPVSAAVRTAEGDIVTGVNLAHFTGGPCAEVVALANVAAAGTTAQTIVAVSANTLLPPCGRCRQIMIDYWPQVNLVVPDADGQPVNVAIRDLLPFAYLANE